VTPLPTLPPATSAISSEPPPRSPTTPSAAQIDDTTPRPESCASRGPVMRSISHPIARSANSTNCGVGRVAHGGGRQRANVGDAHCPA